jgi:acetyl esterase/lipase
MAAGKPRFYRRKWFWGPIATIAVLLVAAVLALRLSPRPGAWLIRTVFESNSGDVKAKLEKHTPDGVTLVADQHYRPGDDDAYLDVYFPAASDQAGVRLPTLIWTHGGAWISGDKADASPYFEIIANEGYTVVSLDYSLGPEEKYPTAVLQINDALAYLQANAERLHIDPDRIAMTGDSAGAQLTSQIAALTTNPEYAAELGITPSLRPEQLRGVVLHCGIYDLITFMDHANLEHNASFLTNLLGWGSRTSIWAYTGSRDGDTPVLRQMSSIEHATADFPATFISGGNGDPLTKDQSIPLAEKLKSLGVETQELFYPDDHEPSLGHEYQFNLDNEDGQNALAQTLAFLKTHLSS